jgi:uncharacterized protein GlcG (DUF336 family)
MAGMGSGHRPFVEALEDRCHLNAGDLLSAAQVTRILGQAASQARSGQAIAVVSREGFVLGVFGMRGTTPAVVGEAIVRARTAAYFQSRQEAFTTRTARFIIQDRFPEPVPNTLGGPLYGVQFSSFATDAGGKDNVLTAAQAPGISGDPGGVPLYERGEPVGGIGVAGDGHDIAFRKDALPKRGRATDDNPRREFFDGTEESDFDESVALAGAAGFMAPEKIRATNVFVDGLRFPFIADDPAKGKAKRTIAQIQAAGKGAVVQAVVGASPEASPRKTIAGFAGQVMQTFEGSARPIAESRKLTERDVRLIVRDAVLTAKRTRAMIRLPIGVAARVHIAVVDLDGAILGVYRMEDGTRFSYDVAVQKARTAAFFSSDRRAVSTRAVGFLAQGFFPPGQENTGNGPLFGLQEQLSLRKNKKGRLQNGITVFPGGVPLYKDGVLVGAIGISGDGVDQDDMIADGGAAKYAPPQNIRVDRLATALVVSHLQSKVDELAGGFSLSPTLLSRMRRELAEGLHGVRLPYVKFPRNPDI